MLDRHFFLCEQISSWIPLVKYTVKQIYFFITICKIKYHILPTTRSRKILLNAFTPYGPFKMMNKTLFNLDIKPCKYYYPYTINILP